MNNYVITTDNNADLPEEFYKEHQIGCTYFSYTLDGKEYTKENFLPVEEFYSKMRAGSMQIFLEKYLMRERISFISRFLPDSVEPLTAVVSQHRN